MKTSILPILFFSGSLILPTSADSVAGKIGDIEVKTEELREMISGLESSNGSIHPKSAEALNEYVRALLIQKWILKKAEEKSWDQDPKVVHKIVRAREAVIAETFIDAACKLPEGYPSEAELAAAYEKAKGGLLIPKSYRIAQIYVAKKRDQARVDEIVGKLKSADANFASLAATYSDEPQAATTQGEIGWVAESQLHSGLRDVVKSLVVGKVSAPILLDDGWHIVKLHETKEARTPTLAEIKDQLTAELRAQRLQVARQEYLAQLLQEHPLAINEIELLKLLKP
jgi:hypothetical protein